MQILHIFAQKLPYQWVYNTVHIQNCYSNRVYLHGYYNFLFAFLSHFFSLFSHPHSLSSPYSLSLSLSFPKTLQSIEKGEEEEEINSNKSKNSSQIQLKITQNKIQQKTHLKKSNQPKTQAEATIATAMVAWVECLPSPWERKWRFNPYQTK